MYRVALAGLIIVVLGEVGLLMLPSLRMRLFTARSAQDHAAAAPLAVAPSATATAPTVSRTAAPAPVPAPQVILVGPATPAEKMIALPQVVAAPVPKPERTPPPAPAIASAAAPPVASAQPMTTQRAVTAEPVVAAAAQPVTVRLSYTADETEKAASLAQRLRRSGLAVTSILIPPSPGRWPGVAFFFASDRTVATDVARQLTDITGRHEHARLSDRHPYPQAGTIEVSLIRSDQPKTGTARKRVHGE